MKKELVNIDNFFLTKLNKNEYEYSNETEKIDFHFVVESRGETTLFLFDSEIKNNEQAFIGTINSSSLTEAVTEISHITKANLKDFVMWQ